MWRKELTICVKAFSGPDRKSGAQEQRTLDAMAGEAADTCGAPKDDGDE